MKPEDPRRTERRQLYRRIVYLYFGLFSMALAERFSMNIAYGAALYISLAALLRIANFIISTRHDTRTHNALKAAAAVFFILTALYTVILYPLFNPRGNALCAMAIIALPFVMRSGEAALLRGIRPSGKLAMLPVVLPSAVLTTGAAALLALPGGSDTTLFAAWGMLAGTALNMPLHLLFRDFEHIEQSASGVTDTRTIRSVRLFDGMAVTSGVALNIFAFTYILLLMFTRTHDVFRDFFLSFCFVAAVLCAAFLAASRVRRSSLTGTIGRNAIYVLGTAIAIFAAYVLRESWFGSVWDISLQTTLLLLGLVLQMAGAQGLQEDMLLLVRLYQPEIDADALRRRFRRLSFWTSVLSDAIFLVVLLALISSPFFAPFRVTDYIPYAPAIGSAVAAIPTVLLFASLWLSLRQPLSAKYSRRLKTLEGIREKGGKNPAMEKRLWSVLVQKTKKRIGVHIIRGLLRPVMHHTVKGKEHVRDLPGIFVFNHREVYGPIAAIVFLPYDIRPWILYQMIDKAEITQHMYEGTFRRAKWLPPALRRLIPRLLSPVVVWALRSFDPIPVYRGAQMNVIKTFMMSIECLAAGDSILLFPENPENTYGQKVSDFYEGFAHLGRLYYKKTGNALTFYPVYASKKRRELRIGEGVTYNTAGGSNERGRIVETLEQRMRDLEALDEH